MAGSAQIIALLLLINSPLNVNDTHVECFGYLFFSFFLLYQTFWDM